MYMLISQSYAGYISDIARCAHSLWNINLLLFVREKNVLIINEMGMRGGD